MTTKLVPTFAKQVAKCVLDHYAKSIPNKGKPQSNNREWTLLSAIVMSKEQTLQVVAMGTGTKCIGHSQMVNNGSLINDAHAEIIARRSFILYLYEQIQNAKQQKESIFTPDETRFKLKENILFHLYASISPCGDASIFEIQHEHVGEKRKIYTDEQPKKKLKTSITGAKPITANYVPQTKTTDEEEKEDYGDGQQVGIVRTKPGRGPRTLSMSCSDKIARWNLLGIQGALLTRFISPIYLNTITIGEEKFYNQESVQRAFFDRLVQEPLSNTTLPPGYKINNCPVYCVEENDLHFVDRKTEERSHASGTSISFAAPETVEVILSHKGLKQGVTKKLEKTEKARSQLCKVNLFKKFVELVPDASEVTYEMAKKNYAKEYGMVKDVFRKTGVFQDWSTKDANLQAFTIEQSVNSAQIIKKDKK